MMRTTLLLTALISAASPVLAQQKGLYGGVMVGNHRYETLDFGFDMLAVTGRLGYEFTRNLAAEGRVAVSLEGSSRSADAQADLLLGAYGKFSWYPSRDMLFDVYGLVGFSGAQMTVQLAEGTDEADDDDVGLSFGVGMDFFADEKHGINLEWVRYLDGTLFDENYTLDHWGVGYVRRF